MSRMIIFTLILGMMAPLAMASDRGTRQSDKIREKLEIRIPKVSFENARIEDVIAYLRAESKRLDPDGEGVNIVYVKRPTKAKAQPKPAAAAQPDWLQ